MTHTRVKPVYRVVPCPRLPMSTCETWDIHKDGAPAYVVKCSDLRDGYEWTCSCPDMSEAPAARREMRRRAGGCKHIRLVKCSLGDHKFLPSLAGPDCAWCGITEAEHDYLTYGPPDPPMTADRRDY